MFDIDVWQEIFNSIRRHKLRTMLTALGVFLGIFILVVMMGAGQGLQSGVEHNFKDDAINSIWMWRGETSMPYKGLSVGRRIQFTGEDYEMLKGIEGADAITGRYYLNSSFQVTRGNKSRTFRLRAVHPDHQVLENTITDHGRFINDVDIKESRKVICIGRLVKESLFEADEEPLGDYLNIDGIKYKIVGVFTDTGSDREMEMIYFPITTAQKIYEGSDRIHQLMFTLKTDDLADSKRVEEEVRAKMAALHNFDPKDNQAIYINNNMEEFRTFRDFFTAIKSFIWVVGIGSILAGMIGVSNIMLIVVKDRTKEIGVRKALGATPKSILTMIILESVVVTAIAGYLGLLFGVGLIHGVDTLLTALEAESEFFRNPQVNLSMAIYANTILIFSGALAGLIPALQAIKINPVVAMKS